MKKVLFVLFISVTFYSCGEETDKVDKKKNQELIIESEQNDPESLNVDSVIVEGTKEVLDKRNSDFAHPRFSYDDNKLFFTTNNYNGIWMVNLDGYGEKKITDARGSGYKFAISGTKPVIYYRQDEFGKHGLKLSYSIVKHNYKTGESGVVYQSKSEISYPISFKGGVAFIKDNKTYFIENGDKISGPDDSEFFYAYSKVNKLIIIQNKKKKVLTPDGGSNIIWTEVMPGTKKVVYTAAGKGTYIFNIKDSTKTKLDSFEEPRFSGVHSLLVFTKSTDDGMKTTGSDIYIYNDNSRKIQNITDSKDEIELHPAWSNDGKMIAFNNLNGQIKIIKLTIVN